MALLFRHVRVAHCLLEWYLIRMLGSPVAWPVLALDMPAQAADAGPPLTDGRAPAHLAYVVVLILVHNEQLT